MTLAGLLRLLQARGIKGELDGCCELLDCSPGWSMHHGLTFTLLCRHENLGMKEDKLRVCSAHLNLRGLSDLTHPSHRDFADSQDATVGRYKCVD